MHVVYIIITQQLIGVPTTQELIGVPTTQQLIGVSVMMSVPVIARLKCYRTTGFV